MVSLNTILAIGGLAIAFITFTRLGGASGIGARLGGGALVLLLRVLRVV